MNKIYLISLFFLFTNCIKQINSEEKINKDHLPNCNIHIENKIYFSDFNKYDKLIINITGQPCFQSQLKINIIKNGILVYDYQSDFNKHIAVNWEDTNLDKYAYEFISNIITNSLKSTKDLPEYLPADEYYEEYYNNIKISKNYYNELRTLNIPMFYHLTGYETWRYVIYSKENNSNIIVLEGGF